MGVVSFILSMVGMALTLLSFIWDFKFLPQDFLNTKMAVLSFLLPINMVLLGIGLVLGIIAYAIDSKRDFAMLGIIFSAFFGLVCLNYIFITFEVLDRIKYTPPVMNTNSITNSITNLLLHIKVLL